MHHSRCPLFYAVLLTVLALATVSTWPLTTLAVNLSFNGDFELFDPYVENGQAQFWREFPERQGRGWTVRVLSGADRLHFMDSDTFGRFLQTYYNVGYLNYHLEGEKAQAFASQYPFSFVFSQTVTVESGVDYVFGGKVVTFWKGPGGEVDHSKIYKRIGVDPAGGSDPLAESVIWSEWDGRDNEWLSPTLAVTAQASRATLFIHVENRGSNVGVQYLNTGYLDSFHFERAPIVTLDTPTHAPPGTLWVSWSATLPDPSYWSLWGYDVQLCVNDGDWQTIQQVSRPGGQAQSTILQLQPNATYTLRVRAWQQRKPDGDPTIPALPSVWVERRIRVAEGGNPGSYNLFLPVISQSPPPTPTPTCEPTVPPSPTPSPEPITSPTPSTNAFRLATVRMLSITENGGCEGNHHVFLSVIDRAGNPLFGPVIGDPPANNFRVTSGDKNEPFFNYGIKTAEIALYSSGTRLRVIENPAGTPVTSEQTPLLSTNTWEIPVEWLVEAGYCPDVNHCSGLLCQGHYSYWVVFQAQ
ncbi:MAG: hypothetical protein DDG58_14455 [Ardenticatenia bacterium]|jgi:hypothetical protein|nr:MAG: hypothetical protein DDG58_14455 [Ardenticatenia bacterium]